MKNYYNKKEVSIYNRRVVKSLSTLKLNNLLMFLTANYICLTFLFQIMSFIFKFFKHFHDYHLFILVIKIHTKNSRKNQKIKNAYILLYE